MLQYLPKVTQGNLRIRTYRTKRFLMLFGEKGWTNDRSHVTSAETITSQTSHDEEESIENCLQSRIVRCDKTFHTK
ncbi:unnamed protein product [Rhizophagus irregularis]|nr:unnamed protein product [Rhizophagus irregularis]